MSKADAQRNHVRDRAAARFGIDFTRDHQLRIIRQIQRGELEFVERQSNRVTLWRGELAGEGAVFVYDSDRKTIVTVLPRPRKKSAA